MNYMRIFTIENELKRQYQLTGHCSTIRQVVPILARNQANIFHDDSDIFPEKAFQLIDEEFYECFSQGAFPIDEFLASLHQPDWRNMPLSPRDHKFIHIFKHINFTNQEIHTHNYFEITYILKGCCSMTFENKAVSFQAGDVCIIAPKSAHGIEILDTEVFALNIVLSKKAFENIFQQLMIGGDLVCKYLQTILYQEDMPNYLFIHTSNSQEMKLYAKAAACEEKQNGYYSSNKAITWITLFLETIFSEFQHNIHMYRYEDSTMQENHLLLVQYLQSNFQTATLDSVADFFHYNKSYLSRLVVKLTGKSFSSLVTEMKLEKACGYLKNTDLRMSEIAELCGFDNQNYFAKVFRKYYGQTPTEYRGS